MANFHELVAATGLDEDRYEIEFFGVPQDGITDYRAARKFPDSAGRIACAVQGTVTLFVDARYLEDAHPGDILEYVLQDSRLRWSDGHSKFAPCIVRKYDPNRYAPEDGGGGGVGRIGEHARFGSGPAAIATGKFGDDGPRVTRGRPGGRQLRARAPKEMPAGRTKGPAGRKKVQVGRKNRAWAGGLDETPELGRPDGDPSFGGVVPTPGPAGGHNPSMMDEVPGMLPFRDDGAGTRIGHRVQGGNSRYVKNVRRKAELVDNRWVMTEDASSLRYPAVWADNSAWWTPMNPKARSIVERLLHKQQELLLDTPVYIDAATQHPVYDVAAWKAEYPDRAEDWRKHLEPMGPGNPLKNPDYLTWVQACEEFGFDPEGMFWSWGDLADKKRSEAKWAIMLAERLAVSLGVSQQIERTYVDPKTGKKTTYYPGVWWTDTVASVLKGEMQPDQFKSYIPNFKAEAPQIYDRLKALRRDASAGMADIPMFTQEELDEFMPKNGGTYELHPEALRGKHTENERKMIAQAIDGLGPGAPNGGMGASGYVFLAAWDAWEEANKALDGEFGKKGRGMYGFDLIRNLAQKLQDCHKHNAESKSDAGTAAAAQIAALEGQITELEEQLRHTRSGTPGRRDLEERYSRAHDDLYEVATAPHHGLTEDEQRIFEHLANTVRNGRAGVPGHDGLPAPTREEMRIAADSVDRFVAKAQRAGIKGNDVHAVLDALEDRLYDSSGALIDHGHAGVVEAVRGGADPAAAAAAAAPGNAEIAHLADLFADAKARLEEAAANPEITTYREQIRPLIDALRSDDGIAGGLARDMAAVLEAHGRFSAAAAQPIHDEGLAILTNDVRLALHGKLVDAGRGHADLSAAFTAKLRLFAEGLLEQCAELPAAINARTNYDTGDNNFGNGVDALIWLAGGANGEADRSTVEINTAAVTLPFASFDHAHRVADDGCIMQERFPCVYEPFVLPDALDRQSAEFAAKPGSANARQMLTMVQNAAIYAATIHSTFLDAAIYAALDSGDYAAARDTTDAETAWRDVLERSFRVPDVADPNGAFEVRVHKTVKVGDALAPLADLFKDTLFELAGDGFANAAATDGGSCVHYQFAQAPTFSEQILFCRGLWYAQNKGVEGANGITFGLQSYAATRAAIRAKTGDHAGIDGALSRLRAATAGAPDLVDPTNEIGRLLMSTLTADEFYGWATGILPSEAGDPAVSTMPVYTIDHPFALGCLISSSTQGATPPVTEATLDRFACPNGDPAHGRAGDADVRALHVIKVLRPNQSALGLVNGGLVGDLAPLIKDLYAGGVPHTVERANVAAEMREMYMTKKQLDAHGDVAREHAMNVKGAMLGAMHKAQYLASLNQVLNNTTAMQMVQILPEYGLDAAAPPQAYIGDDGEYDAGLSTREEAHATNQLRSRCFATLIEKGIGQFRNEIRVYLNPALRAAPHMVGWHAKAMAVQAAEGELSGVSEESQARFGRRPVPKSRPGKRKALL